MRCIACNSNTRVVNSRRAAEHITRRRQCRACSLRFTTCEIVVPDDTGATVVNHGTHLGSNQPRSYTLKGKR